MIRYEAYIQKDWQELGIVQVIAARLRENGTVEAAVWLVDLWCLGVKDVFFLDVTADVELREILRERIPEHMREPIHPACAKKLIEGGVQYAQQFGFAPHRDYKKALRVFNGVEARACTEIYTYGKDGKPMFVASEDDTPERVQRVLTMLEARCGKDGFHYLCRGEVEGYADEDADSDDAIALREDLIDWFAGEPDEVPSFCKVSGLITGMQLCPQVITPTKLFEVLWGPKGRRWKNQTELREFTSLIMSYWNQISEFVADSLSTNEACVDVYAQDFDEGDTESLVLGLVEWSAGFVLATEYCPEAWAEPLARSDLLPHWELLRCMAHPETAENASRLALMAKESPPRVLGTSSLALARALRKAKPL